MAGTGNAIDLVPQEALDQIKQLEKELQTTIRTSGSFLTVATEINKTLSNQAASYKDITKAVSDYYKAEEEIISVQKQQQQIVEQINKVREEAIQQTSQEVKTTQELRKNIEETNKVRQQEKSLIDISRKAYEEAEKSIASQQKQYIVLQNELKGIQAQIKALDKAYANNTSDEKYLQRKVQLIDAEQDQKASIKTLGDTIKANGQIIRTNIGSYDNLSAQYSRLKIEINQTSDAAKRSELEAHAKRIYEEMNRLQQATGKSQLQVGQYDLAVKDLTKTLSILDPRIGAIVNKSKQITPVKKAWLAVNEQLQKSLNVTASTATVLQAAIIGLVVGAIVLAVKAFQNWYDEQEKLFQRQLEFERKQNDIRQAVRNQALEIQNLLIVARNYNASLDTRRESIERLNAIIPNYNASLSKEGEFLAENEQALKDYLKVLFRVETVKAAISDWQEVTKNLGNVETEAREALSWWDKARIRILNYIGAAQAASNLEQSLISLDRYNLTREYATEQKRLFDIIKEGLNDPDVAEFLYGGGSGDKNKQIDAEKKAYLDLLLFRIQQEAAAAKEILSNEEYSLSERLGLINNYIDKQAEAIQKAADNQLANENLTKSQRILIQEKANVELAKLQQERDKISNDLLKKSIEEQIKIINEGVKEANQALSERESNELTDASALYLSGELDREEYEQRKTEITRRYALERFKIETDSLREVLNQYEIGSLEYESIQQKIKDAELAYDQEINRQIIADNENTAREIERNEQEAARKRKKIEEDLAKARMRLFQEVADFAFQLISNSFTSQVNQLDDQLSYWEDYYKERNELIDEQERAGLVTSEYAATQRKYLTDEQEKREEELEEKRKEILTRQAKFEKAQSAISAAINTAVAVTKAYADAGPIAGIPLAAMIAAIGAVQVATILAKPLPQYKYGTDDHPGGPAIVGDGGRSEMAVFPDGSIYKTPSVPTLVNMPSGTQVLPDFSQAFNVLPEVKSSGPTVVVDNSRQIRLLEQNNKITKVMNDRISSGLRIIINDMDGVKLSRLNRNIIKQL